MSENRVAGKSYYVTMVVWKKRVTLDINKLKSNKQSAHY